MCHRFSRLYKAFIIAAGIFILVAAPVLAYTFRASYVVTNNSSTSYDMLGVWTPSNNDWMASNSFMGSTGLDSRIETLGGSYKPHLLTENMTLTAIPSSAGSQTNLYFTTGSSNLSAYDIVTGRGGYVTIADSANLEHGANFTETLTDVGLYGNGNILSKTGAYILSKSSTNVTFASYGGPLSETRLPSGAGDETNITSVTGAPTHWQAVSDSNDATYVNATNPANLRDLYQLQDLTFSVGYITSVNVTLRINPFGGGTTAVKVAFKIGGTVYEGSDLSATGAGWVSRNEVFSTSPATGAVWTIDEINAMQVGVTMVSGTGGVAVSEESVLVNYLPSTVTVTGISDGEYDLTVIADSVNVWMTVGSSVSANATVAAVPNNANNITLGSNVTPYIGSYTLSVGGNQQVRYEPNAMIVGTNLPDRGSDATSNNGTITWGVNPTDVTVTLGAMISATAPSGTAVADPPPADILPAVAGQALTQTAGVPAALLTNPLRPFVTMVSDNTSLTEIQVWRWDGLIFVLMVTGIVLRTVKGHLGIASIAAGVAIGVVVALQIWPLYGLLAAAICFFGGVALERTPSY